MIRVTVLALLLVVLTEARNPPMESKVQYKDPPHKADKPLPDLFAAQKVADERLKSNIKIEVTHHFGTDKQLAPSKYENHYTIGGWHQADMVYYVNRREDSVLFKKLVIQHRKWTDAGGLPPAVFKSTNRLPSSFNNFKYNTQNEIAFAPSPKDNMPSKINGKRWDDPLLAITHIHRSNITGEITEADIMFCMADGDFAWGGGEYDIASVMTTELGRSLGMGHSGCPEHAMYPQTPKRATHKRLLNKGDVRGIRQIMQRHKLPANAM